MQLTSDRLLLSASDLVSFMEGEHLAALDLRAVQGVETIAVSRNDSALLVVRKGDEYERAYIELTWLRAVTSGPGEVVIAPPGVRHLAWNPTDEPVHLRIQMSPALSLGGVRRAHVRARIRRTPRSAGSARSSCDA